jgi:hypothetical protein
MAATAKIFLSRFDVVLIALSIVAGMAVWSVVELGVDWGLDRSEPHEEAFYETRHVPLLQAKLVTAQEELAAVRKRAIEQRLEHQRDVATLRALRADAPRSRAATILSLRPETLSAAAEARLEWYVAQRLVIGLEAEAAGLERKGPPANAKSASASRPITEAQGAALADQLAATQKALTEARMGRSRAAARVEGIEALYPVLAQLTPTDVMLLSLPTETQQAATTAVSRLSASERLIAMLASDLAAQSAVVDETTRDYTKAKREADRDLSDARTNWGRTKRTATLLISLVLLAALGAVAPRAGSALKVLGVRFNGRLVLGLSASGLLILYGFQVAQFTGAAVAGLLVVLIFLWLAAPSEAAPVPAGDGGPKP